MLATLVILLVCLIIIAVIVPSFWDVTFLVQAILAVLVIAVVILLIMYALRIIGYDSKKT